MSAPNAMRDVPRFTQKSLKLVSGHVVSQEGLQAQRVGFLQLLVLNTKGAMPNINNNKTFSLVDQPER